MNFISSFQSIESKIESLSFLQKIELYLLPLLLGLFFIFSFSINSNSYEIESIEKQINTLNHKSLNKPYVQLLKEYTTFIKDNHLLLKSIDIKGREIFLSVSSTPYKILQLLLFIDSSNDFSSFRLYSLKKDDKLYQIDIYVDYKKMYLKSRDFKFKNIASFLNEEKIFVDSIIAGFVNIDGKWFGVDDCLKEDIILKIEDGYIYLKSGKKIKVLKNGEFK